MRTLGATGREHHRSLGHQQSLQGFLGGLPSSVERLWHCGDLLVYRVLVLAGLRQAYPWRSWERIGLNSGAPGIFVGIELACLGLICEACPSERRKNVALRRLVSVSSSLSNVGLNIPFTQLRENRVEAGGTREFPVPRFLTTAVGQREKLSVH